MAGFDYDVVIVGGGPAGSTAAREAAAAGVSVLLLEAKRRFGERPHCAGYVPRFLALEMDFPAECAVQTVRAMKTRLLDRRVVTAAPGFILDRGRFDYALAKKAVDCGAEALCGARLKDLEKDRLLVRAAGREMWIRAGAIIAADGAASTVRRLLGRPGADLLTGIQMEVPLKNSLDQTLVFFDRRYYRGYAWLFPKGRLANLGLGMVEQRPGQAWALLEALAGDLRKQELIQRGCLSRSVGAINVSGPESRLTEGRIILAGDAAGLTHPITGAGVPQAVFSGAAAGRAAVELIKKNNPESLAAYEREVLGLFGRTLAWALDKRKYLKENWELGDFNHTVARTWPAFREYQRA